MTMFNAMTRTACPVTRYTNSVEVIRRRLIIIVFIVFSSDYLRQSGPRETTFKAKIETTSNTWLV